jgi:uncharacterized membrane protein YbhN (UPF0104 family)
MSGSSPYRAMARAGLGCILAIAIAYLMWRFRDEFLKIVRSLSFLQLGGVVAVLLLQWIARALRDQVLYRGLGCDIAVLRILWVNNLQIALNYLPMKVGTVSSAEIFRRTSGLRYGDFAVAMFQQYLYTFFLSFAVASLGVLFVAGHNLQFRVFASGGLLVLALLPWGLAILSSRLSIKFSGRLGRFLGGIGRFSGFFMEPWVLAKVLVFSLMAMFCSAIRIFLLYQGGGFSLGLPEAILFSSALQVSTAISITPAGLGVSEGLAALMATSLSYAATEGVVFSVLDRFIVLFSSLGIVMVGTVIRFLGRIGCIVTDQQKG